MQFKRRAKLWKDVLVRPAWRWLVVAPFALLGIYQTIREEFILSRLPNDEQDKYLWNWLDWQWEWWLLIALVFTIVTILESAFRRVRPVEDQLDKLNDIAKQREHLQNQLVTLVEYRTMGTILKNEFPQSAIKKPK